MQPRLDILTAPALYFPVPRLPDRFDLWVRRASACTDPTRAADYVLGALAVLPEWHFLNQGTRENPQPFVAETSEGARHLVVFSDVNRLLEVAPQPENEPSPTPPIISIPTDAAFTWCQDPALACSGLLVNPSPQGQAVMIPMDQIVAFVPAWRESRSQRAQGYWIPNLTSEEEDFWQEQGL